MRALSAFIEAACFMLRRAALSAFDQEKVEFRPEEVVWLREQTYAVDQEGEVILSQERFLPSKSGILFSLKMLARLQGGTFKVPAGWDHMQAFIDLRNRLTHPKDKCDVELKEKDFATAQSAFKWFSAALSEVHRNIGPPPPPAT